MKTKPQAADMAHAPQTDSPRQSDGASLSPQAGWRKEAVAACVTAADAVARSRAMKSFLALVRGWLDGSVSDARVGAAAGAAYGEWAASNAVEADLAANLGFMCVADRENSEIAAQLCASAIAQLRGLRRVLA